MRLRHARDVVGTLALALAMYGAPLHAKDSFKHSVKGGGGGGTGATGPQGPQGKIGPAGAAGATGAQGPQGKSGPQGSSGPQGPQGAPGTAGLYYSDQGAQLAADVSGAQEVVAYCRPGDLATGGGFDIQLAPDVKVVRSQFVQEQPG